MAICKIHNKKFTPIHVKTMRPLRFVYTHFGTFRKYHARIVEYQQLLLEANRRKFYSLLELLVL